MDDAGEGVDRLAVHEDVELDELFGLPARRFVVEAAVAARDGFEAVVEVDQDLVHGDAGGDHHVVGVDALRVRADAALVHHQVHDVADILGGGHDVGVDERLLNVVDLGRVGQVHRVVDLQHVAVAEVHVVDHARIGGDDVHVVLAAEAFLHDLHVEESEESAAEPEAKGGGRFGLVVERRVVELELRHAELELFVVGGVDGVDAAEDHRLHVLEPGQRLGAGRGGVGDRVAHLRVGGRFQIRDDVTDVSGFKLGHGFHLGREDADFLDLAFEAGAEHLQAVSACQTAVEHADVRHHAPVGVVDGVEDQRGGPVLGGLLRRRHALHDGLEQFRNAGAVLRGDQQDFLARDRQNLLELVVAQRQVGGGEVDLVDDRDDEKVVAHGEVHVRDGLRLHALGGVEHEDRALAGGERTAHLIGKIHVAGSVDEVQLVFVSVGSCEEHANRVGFDRDPAFLFQVHGVQELGVDEVALFDRMGDFEHAVGKRRLPVVDMCDDGEIADAGQVIHGLFLWILKRGE